MNIMNAAIYARVSTEEQATDGYSVRHKGMLCQIMQEKII